MSIESPAPFVLDEDHLEFRDTVRRFARNTFLDGALSRAMSTEYPRRELAQLAESELLGLCVPERFGGQGATELSLGIACQELSYADTTCGYLAFGANVAAGILSSYGTEKVTREWLPRLIDGAAVACIALTEPESGSDAAAMRTRATRVQSGWRLRGEKTSVTQAVHADIALVIAQTDPERGTKGTAMFLVPLGDPTISIHGFTDPGFKPLSRGSITMDGTFVPEECLLGEVGHGFRVIMREFDLTRTLLALMVAGTAQRAIDMAVEYAKQRTAFGRPIAANQGVSFPIAEHSTYLAAVQALAFHTLGLRMAGLPHTTQAAMLKWWAPEVAFNAIKDAIVLHGHTGWSDEMPLQAMLRDVSGILIGDGTPQIQKTIIARELIGRAALGE